MYYSMKYGILTMSLPNQSESYFSIFEDLAEMFVCDYQSEAVWQLKHTLKQITDLKSKPNIDYESYYTHIISRSPETIFKVAQCIHILTKIQKPEISAQENDDMLMQLKKWKRPKKQKWKIGNIFSMKLKDESFLFGQILARHITP